MCFWLLGTMSVSLKFEFKRREKNVCGEDGASREGKYHAKSDVMLPTKIVYVKITHHPTVNSIASLRGVRNKVAENLCISTK